MKRMIVKRMAAAVLVAAMAVTVVPVTNVLVVKAADETPSFPAGSQEPTDSVVTGEVNQDIIVNYISGHQTRIYSFVAPENGYATVNVHNYNPASDWKTQLWIIDADNGRQLDFEDWGDLVKNSIDFAVTKGRTYQIKTYVGNGKAHTNVIRFNFTAADNWEVEPNDNISQYSLIDEGKNYYGRRNQPDTDVDLFEFVLTKDRNVTIKFGPANPGGSGRWITWLNNEKSERINLGDDINAQTEHNYNLKAGKYYFGVGGYHSSIAYKYCVSYTTSPIKSLVTPRIKKLSGYRYKNSYAYNRQYGKFDYITLNGAGVDVVGYRVKIAAKKNMKEIAVDKTVNISPDDRTLIPIDTSVSFKKKVAYVTVQPYVKDPFGHEIWGKRSKVKAVKLSFKK